MLRLQPSLGIDRGGRHGVIKEARLLASAGKTSDALLPYEFDDDNATALAFPLPTPVEPGESVTVELESASTTCRTSRAGWGHWNGVTFLTNSLPLLAFYDDTGWQPMPFVPWHQPFFNEAGVYTAAITLPDERGPRLLRPRSKSETNLGDGWQAGRRRSRSSAATSRCCAATRSRSSRPTTKLPDGRDGRSCGASRSPSTSSTRTRS